MASRKLLRLPGFDVDEPQAARKGKSGPAGCHVRGVVDDPAGLLPDPFTARQLLRRESPVRSGQSGRIGEQPFGHAGHVERPQTGRRVIAAP